MKIFMIVLILISFGCARHHEKTSHHHHQVESTKKVDFNSLCAESLAEGDTHIVGKPEFSLEHADHIYYFSTLAKKKKFESNLVENIKKAEINFERAK